MSLPSTAGGYGLGREEGEALWFNGGLGILKATAAQTGGQFAVLELLAPMGFASPLHIHRNEDEFFVVLSGDVRVRHGDKVMEAPEGSLVYGPAGVEGFFRDAGKPARSRELPPSDEQFLPKEALAEIGARYHQEFIGPPLPPKD